MKKTILKGSLAIWTALALACGAVAADSTIYLVEGETAKLTTSGKVYKKSKATFTVSSGTGLVGVSATETGNFGTTAEKTAATTQVLRRQSTQRAWLLRLATARPSRPPIRPQVVVARKMLIRSPSMSPRRST